MKKIFGIKVLAVFLSIVFTFALFTPLTIYASEFYDYDGVRFRVKADWLIEENDDGTAIYIATPEGYLIMVSKPVVTKTYRDPKIEFLEAIEILAIEFSGNIYERGISNGFNHSTLMAIYRTNQILGVDAYTATFMLFEGDQHVLVTGALAAAIISTEADIDKFVDATWDFATSVEIINAVTPTQNTNASSDTTPVSPSPSLSTTPSPLIPPNLTGGIQVLLNGTPIQFDQSPIIVDGRTMVPLRAIFEALGATIEWNSDTQTVTTVKDNIIVSMQIGNSIMQKNGSNITLDIPPTIVNGRTLVPARAVAESFGVEVSWDADTQTVTLAS